MKLTELITDFLEYLQVEKNVSPLTIRNYAHYLDRFTNWLESTSPTLSDPTNIKDETIRKYRVFLSQYVDSKNMTLKRITQNYHLIALRAFLRFLSRRDIKALSPDKIDLAKAESRSLKFLNRDQLKRLFDQPGVDSIQGIRDRAILELLFSTGLRVSELVRLNRDQLDFKSREIGVLGKGGRPRVVFISETAVDWLKQYLGYREDKYKPLFVRYSGKRARKEQGEDGVRLSSRSIERLVEKYVKKARLPIKITPHGIRHSFATDLLSSGADLRAIQEMLGHKNVSTTQIYTHVTNPRLKEIHTKYHDKKR